MPYELKLRSNSYGDLATPKIGYWLVRARHLADRLAVVALLIAPMSRPDKILHLQPFLID